MLGIFTPVLSAASRHGFAFAPGQIGAAYTITVTNNGPGATSGMITLTDALPLGLTATGMSGAGWTCVLATLVCTRSDSLAAATSYPPVTLIVNVSQTAPSTVTNLVTVAGVNAIGSSSSDVTLIAAAALGVVSAHTGSFAQGQTGAAYTVTVLNRTGAGATSGTVTDTLSSGLTLTAMAGAGWTCTGNTCSRNDVLNPGASYPVIVVTVNVATTASSPQVNTVSVSVGGSAAANTTDSTIINPLPVAFALCAYHSLPRGRYAQRSRRIWRPIGHRWRLLQFHHPEQRLRRARHGPSLFLECCGCARR